MFKWFIDRQIAAAEKKYGVPNGINLRRNRSRRID